MSPVVTRSGKVNQMEERPSTSVAADKDSPGVEGVNAHDSEEEGRQAAVLTRPLSRSASVISVRSSGSGKTVVSQLEDEDRRAKKVQIELEMQKLKLQEELERLVHEENRQQILDRSDSQDDVRIEVIRDEDRPKEVGDTRGIHHYEQDLLRRENDVRGNPSLEQCLPRDADRQLGDKPCGEKKQSGEEDTSFNRKYWDDPASRRMLRSDLSCYGETTYQKQPEERRPQLRRIPEAEPASDMQLMFARQSAAKDLPMFWGEAEEWPSFVAQFLRSTESCRFSDEENVYRLQKCLKGKARESVLSMLVVGADIEEIMKTLELRFGQPEVIMRNLVAKIRKLPDLDDRCPESFMDFAIAVRNLATTADTLRMPEYSLNPHMMEELLRKLPHHLRLDWGCWIAESKKTHANIIEMSRWLEKKAVGAMKAFVPVEEFKRKSHDGKKGQDRAFVAVEERSCVAGCSSGGHPLFKCKKFLSMKTDERWKLVKKANLCFSCLQSGHSRRSCKRKKTCGIDHCESYHNPLLHAENQRREEPRNRDHRREDPPNGDQRREESANRERSDRMFNPNAPVFGGHNFHSMENETNEVLLRVVPVKIRGEKRCVDTYALCDEGSTLTLMEESLAEELGLKREDANLNLAWLNGGKKISKSSKVEIWISGADDIEYKLENVKTMQDLNLPCQTIKVDKIQKNWRHLRGVPLQSFHGARPRILLGQDQCQLTMPRRIVEGPGNAPVATLTKLGWTLHGRNHYRGLVEEHSSFFAQEVTEDEKLHQLVKEQFSLDSMGISSTAKLPRSKMDTRAEELMERNSRRVDNHWETGMLWKDDDTQLPESKHAALRRLKTLEKQMDRDENFSSMYCSKIEEYLQKGFCRKLSHDEASEVNGRVWYLPHFGRTNPNKPGKLRLVFDCAARVNGLCLNDALLQGPDLMTPLISVLAKFRQKEIAFSGDIRDMFHMVRISKEDLPALRFLWRGKERNSPPDVYTMNVMVFGAVSSPYQAQWIKNRNAEEFKDEFGAGATAIVDRHYVDDYLDSESTAEAAIMKIEAVREIHKRGGFEIRNWLCNNEKVLQKVDAASSCAALDFQDTEKLERVLGLYWDPKSDEFRFKKRFRTVDDTVLSGDKDPTKRDVLKLVMCIFDPLGFVSHLCVRARILIQDIWRMGFGWDEPLTGKLLEKWKTFMVQLDSLSEVRIPRCYNPNISSADDIQLHVFCDASEEAFCAVAYLRVTSQGNVKTNIMVAKTRVAPLRPVSISRLELQAALMGARLKKRIMDDHELPINSTVMWTDSSNVLCWIRAEDPRRFKPFIAHRVGEILELSESSMWRWIPTDLNVADDGTRDAVPADLKPSSRWFHGPSFLLLSDSEWPVEKPRKEAPPEDLEIKKEFALAVKEVTFPDVDVALTWKEMVKAEATRICGNEDPNTVTLIQAETTLIKKSQWETFSDEITLLSHSQNVPKSSRILKLSPFLDGLGVLRMRSRVEYSPNLSEDARAPIILDSKHPITKRIIDDYHLQFNHQGQDLLVNELRQRYWILGVRTAVRSAWRRCEYCMETHARPVQVQMAPLPDIRITRVDRPFTNVGVDYFGPMEVTHLRRKLKRYGLIFVCMSTRAIHLEVTHSLDMDSTLMAMERFICRRGEPTVIWSDNGRSFIGANNEMKKSLKMMEEELAKKFSQKGITWNFIPPLSPHFGGAWERLIRSVKTTMKAILKERAPTDEMLLSVMCEAEATVNSRPLTFVSSDSNDVEAITPNCFLMGTTSVLQPPGTFNDEDVTHRKRWRICQALAEQFWRRWVKEYLPSLGVRQKWIAERKELSIGVRVLIADGSMPRNAWMTGIVVKTFPGKDGHVRVADVKTQHGIFRRPVVKLCPVELETDDGDVNLVSSRGGV